LRQGNAFRPEQRDAAGVAAEARGGRRVSNEDPSQIDEGRARETYARSHRGDDDPPSLAGDDQPDEVKRQGGRDQCRARVREQADDPMKHGRQEEPIIHALIQ